MKTNLYLYNLYWNKGDKKVHASKLLKETLDVFDRLSETQWVFSVLDILFDSSVLILSVLEHCHFYVIFCRFKRFKVHRVLWIGKNVSLVSLPHFDRVSNQ